MPGLCVFIWLWGPFLWVFIGFTWGVCLGDKIDYMIELLVVRCHQDWLSSHTTMLAAGWLCAVRRGRE